MIEQAELFRRWYVCPYCWEEIRPGDTVHEVGGRGYHHECACRLAAGPLGHVWGLCSCHGGNIGDPIAMTRREAARAALKAFRQKRAAIN